MWSVVLGEISDLLITCVPFFSVSYCTHINYLCCVSRWVTEVQEGKHKMINKLSTQASFQLFIRSAAAALFCRYSFIMNHSTKIEGLAH